MQGFSRILTSKENVWNWAIKRCIKWYHWIDTDLPLDNLNSYFWHSVLILLVMNLHHWLPPRRVICKTLVLLVMNRRGLNKRFHTWLQGDQFFEGCSVDEIINDWHNSAIYDKWQTQLAKILALRRDRLIWMFPTSSP